MKQKVHGHRKKKRFTPRDGWATAPQPKRKVFRSRRKLRRAATRRARKTMRSMKKVNTKVDMSPIEVEDPTVFGVILAQLTLKQGMKEFGKERADESIMKEYKMLHDMNCWIPRIPSLPLPLQK